MFEAEVDQASSMQSSEEADVMGEFSALKPFGHDDFFRIVDVLKAGKILETEVEVLRPRSGTCQTDPYRSLANNNFEQIHRTRHFLWTSLVSLEKPSSARLSQNTGKQP